MPSLSKMAEWTGLEPATSGVTGQHSNQLNYHSAFSCNLYNSPARVALHPATLCVDDHPKVVGAEGFEPPTLSV